MAAPAAVLSILVTASTGSASAQLTTLDRQLKGTAATANATAATLGSRLAQGAKYGAIGVAALGAVSVKAAADFDNSMRRVNSIAQLPEKQLAKLGDRVRALSGRTAQAPETLAAGLYDLVSSGFDASESMRVLRSSAKGATAGMTDTATSTKAVAAVLNAYRLPASKAKKVTDQLFNTVNYGVISFEELATNIGDTLPFASQLGVGLDQLGASIATMTKQGLSSSETMTRIRNVLQTLIKPGEDLQAALAELNVSGEELVKKEGLQGALEALVGTTDGTKEAVAGLFPNIRALGGVLALTGKNSREAEADLRKMQDSAGATSEALEEIKKSPGFQWEKLKTQFRNIAIDIGNFLLPALQDVMKILTDPKLTLDEKIAKLGNRVGKAIEEWGPRAAEAGAKVGLAIIKGVASAFWQSDLLGKLFIGAGALRFFGGPGVFGKLGKKVGLLMGRRIPGGLAVGLVLATALLAPDAFKLGEKLGEQMRKPLRRFFKWIVDTFGGVADKVLGVFSGIVGTVADIYDKLAGVPIIGDAFKPAAEGLHDVEDAINGVRDSMREIRKFRDNPLGFTRGLLRENAGDIGAVTNQLQGMGIGYKRAIHLATQAGDEIGPSLKRNERMLQSLGDRLGATGGKWRGYSDDLDRSVTRGNRDGKRHAEALDDALDKIVRAADRTADRVGDYAKDTDKSFDKTTSSSGKMAKGVGRNVQALVNGVGEGLGVLKDNLNKSLAAFKVKSVSYSIKKAGNVVGDVVGAQHGAIVPGTGSGDKVPLHIAGQLAAMVEPGELVSVANRTATERLMAVNKAVPRRQDGGLVPHLAKGGGLMAPFDVQGSKPGFVPFMNFLNNMYGPLYVMSGYRPGSITTSGNVSNHASGHAVDISTHESGVDQATGPGSLGGPGAARMDDLHSYMARNIKLPGDFLWRTYTGGNHYNHIHRGITSAEADDPRKMIAYLSGLPGGGAIAESLKRLILKGPKGPLREMGQGALDKAWKAANDFLSRQGPGYSAGKYLKGKGDIFTASWYGPTPATVGAAGVSLPGTMSFAELSDPPGSLNFSALGGLPYHAKIGVRYKGKAIGVEKLDVGAGGPGLGGHVRAIDLWEDAAKQLPGFMSAGIANVEVLRKHGGLVPRLAKGGIVELLGETIGAIRHMNDKRTTKAVERWGEAVKGYGVPAKLVERMVALRHDADKFGEYASNAATLSDDGIFGRFLGATEAEWTQKQLSALFKLRNRLIAAKKLLDRQIRQQVKVLKEAESRLRQTNRAIGEGEDEREDLEERLEKAKKAKNKDLEEHLQARLDSLDERQEVREAIAAKLKSPIISSLKKLGGRLKGGSKEFSSRSLVEEALTSVQGIDGPMRKLTKLPAIGALGGEIFEAQVTLRNLDAEAHPTDTGLDIAGLRDVIEAARYGVFDRYAGTFGSGGRLGPGQWGIAGETGRPEIVHGPATVLSPQATQGALAGNVVVHNDFDFDGMDLIVTTTVNGELAKQQRLEHRRSRQAVR